MNANTHKGEQNMLHTIRYKTKVKYMYGDNDEKIPYIEFKREVKRADCSMRRHERTYYNSDLFPSMLNRVHKQLTNNKEWCRLTDLPEHISIDTSKFLAVVTITLPDTFK
jgi:hypothetical protein